MEWPRVMEGRGYHQEDAEKSGAGKKKGRPKKGHVARQHQGGHERIPDGSSKTWQKNRKCVAHDDKDPLLHGGSQ